MHTNYAIAALYKFFEFPDFKEVRPLIMQKCIDLQLKGTLLVAHEGINGTIAGEPNNIESILSYLRKDPRLSDLEAKVSYSAKMPFLRMKVKLKKEIVTLGVPGIDPNKETGEYVEPKDWNDLISDPNVKVIDTRNNYEVAAGSFKNSINPETDTFRSFPDYAKRNLFHDKKQKIAMYCTGGIRCEKSTAYLLKEGFENVYHLKGGILKYLEEIPEEDSLWQGDCFVFDNRVTVDEELKQGSYTQCHGCRHPITDKDKESIHYKEGIHCHHCYNNQTEKHFNRVSERHRQMCLASQHNRTHLGPEKDPKKSSENVI